MSKARARRLAIAPCGIALATLAFLATLASGELVQKGTLRVSVVGKLAPQLLPRSGAAPVAVTFGGQIKSTDPGALPQLRKIAISINRHGRLTRRGLPSCRIGNIDPSATDEALAVCGRALVGEGHFSADVKLPEQSPFPSEGKILAFNGVFRGRPAILAHIYGKKPVPTSYTLPFLVRRTKGTFGTVLEASLPRVTGDWGYVTGVDMTLKRDFVFNGRRRSYLTADCPAPAGFRSVFFPLARASFEFEGDVTLVNTLTRGCRVEA